MPIAATRWEKQEGSPHPLGATWLPDEQAWNFALMSWHATSVTLFLYNDHDPTNPVFEKTLPHLSNKSGHAWHCRVPEDQAKGATYYAYRVDGPGREPTRRGTPGWNRFDPAKILIDPYAQALHFPPDFDRASAIGPGRNDGKAPLGILPREYNDLLQPFDWGKDHRPRHDRDLVIYELHIRGFTQHQTSGIPKNKRGTYLGLIEKIPYLKDLGITAVELMPTFQWDPQENNYWGYSPLSFFAPHAGFGSATSPTAHIKEFKQMVKALHEAGIEVILDVVYNHTGELDHLGPTYSFRGIDNATYYLQSNDPEKPYFDVTATGNTVSANHRIVRRLIVDSLLHWVREYHIDGFRFDLAAFASRNTDGSPNLNDPPIIGDILAQNELQSVRLIEEPWDAAGLYQLGLNAPTRMGLQWNDKFRDDMRRFIKGDPGTLKDVAMRLQGSPDLFPDTIEYAKRPWQSINLITCHDGFTLYDLVSYSQKHNLANNQNNEDGSNHNHSSNHGTEGDQGLTPEITSLRLRQAKNLMTLLLLSNGTPLMLAGDEGLLTKLGNNNTYNQDNPTSWLDWDRIERFSDMRRFVKGLLSLRASIPTIARSRFWRSDATFYGLDGPQKFMNQDRAIAMHLSGESVNGSDLYLMLNAHNEPLDFVLPPESNWHRLIDTTLESPHDILSHDQADPRSHSKYHVGERSVVVMYSKA